MYNVYLTQHLKLHRAKFDLLNFIGPGADAKKKFTPILGIPYLGV